MAKNIISILTLSVVFFSLTFFTFNSYKNAKTYEDNYKQYAQEQTIKIL